MQQLFVSLLLGLLVTMATSQIVTPPSDGNWIDGYRSIAIPETFRLDRRKVFEDKDITLVSNSTSSGIERVVL
jgi:hypothetical protein